MTNARYARGLGRSSRYATVAIVLHWLIAALVPDLPDEVTAAARA